MSLTNWNGYGQAEFIGLKNFVDFFKDSRAISDIKTTVLFALGSAPLLNIVGLLYALLMNSKFKGKSVARACIYMPAIISPLIIHAVSKTATAMESAICRALPVA